jgi:hypothetical protein
LNSKVAEAAEKRGKGVEIAFSYDNNDSKNAATADDGLSGESDEENDEVYEPPEGIKLPVGINLVRVFKKIYTNSNSF